MDLSVTSDTGGAVACPVCTLYLREGISLQRHLDTHPKEQVIEALIKASGSGGNGVSNSNSSLLPSSPSQIPHASSLTPPSLTSSPVPVPVSVSVPLNGQGSPQQSHIPAHSPYPIGPVFEYPPLNAMMPPQFASFSYQQFVNNGTMMIPQYAMAPPPPPPQANQMMQMLYNPYSMYQQQQVPTVQMLSPVTTIPTTRSRPVTTMSSDTPTTTTTTTRSVIIPSSSTETKQILPELISDDERENDRVLASNIDPPTTLPIQQVDTVIEEPSGDEEDELQMKDKSQQTQTISRRVESEVDDDRKSIDIDIIVSSVNKSTSILSNLEEQELDISDAECKKDQSFDLEKNHKFDFNNTRYHSGGNKNKSRTDNTNKQAVQLIQPDDDDKIIFEDEMEQELDDNVDKDIEIKVATVNAKHPDISHFKTMEETDLVETFETNHDETMQINHHNEESTKISDKEVKNNLIHTSNSNEEMNIKLCQINEYSFHNSYRYRGSLSVPASPVALKKIHSPCTTKSECGSSENLNLYPVGFEANIIHDDFDDDDDVDDDDDDDDDEEDDDDDDDEEDELEKELDDMEIEIEEIESPHTPFIAIKHNGMDNNMQSHTPISTIGGISGLQIRSKLKKNDCLPSPMRSFGRLKIESHNLGSSESLCHRKNSIDCSQSNSISKFNKNGSEKSLNFSKKSVDNSSNNAHHQSVITEHVSSFSPLIHHSSQQITSTIVHEQHYSMSSNKATLTTTTSTIAAAAAATTTTTTTTTKATTSTTTLKISQSPLDLASRLAEITDPTTSTGSKSFQSMTTKSSIGHIPSTELLNINEDAHSGPMNVFEFDGLQVLVPSTFISESLQKAISATSQQSMASSEGGGGIDEEVKSVNMRADETMPPRGELSEQESNGCTEHSAWQLYVGQESSRMSTSYDLMARESWGESEGSDNETGVPLLDSRSLATHFTSSLFLDRDRKTPTKQQTFQCSHCTEVFDCPKERRVHSTTVHKEAGPSNSSSNSAAALETNEAKDLKLLDGRMNVFEEIFVPGVHAPQTYHHQHQQQQQSSPAQPLLHQMQPPQQPEEIRKAETDENIDGLAIPQTLEISCAMCSQRFSSERSLQVHNRRIHGTEVARRLHDISKCQICNDEFPSVVAFNAHLKIHPLECSQCGKYFYRKQNFKLHMKRHLGIKPFPCTVCDKAFLTKQKLDEHMNGHTGNAPVKCNLCNETFRRYSNLTQHKNRHHLNIKRKLKDYICHCGEVFHTKKKLAWHKETHDEKPKACTYCNERFIHMASLTRHMRRAHNRRFVPDAQRENENVECPICKCIYLRSSLSVHMRVHNGERPYECQVCSKAFSTKWNLQLHKWTHAARSTKPYKCNQCSAAFYRHSDYTAHMNSHRNVRPYTCNYCGAQFIRKYNCLRHVKEHEENKQYTCDVCNKTFHRSYYLKEHLRVHSGARPYTCHICGKSSSTKSNHNKHVRIHHAREPVNTEN